MDKLQSWSLFFTPYLNLVPNFFSVVGNLVPTVINWMEKVDVPNKII